MKGLELITGSIIADAQARADEKIAAAKKVAESIRAEYAAETEKLRNKNAEALAAARQRAEESAESARRAMEREAMLSTKNETVNEIIAEAKAKILSLPDMEYFALLAEIYKNNAEDKEGEILLTASDKKRMPKDFLKKLGRVTLAQDDAPSAGFIIRYGRVELNCTIDAIFEDKQNVLSDIASKALKE